MVPRDIEKEIKNLYLSLGELLKHFWHSFPPNTPELEEKVVRMHESLKRFEATKLGPFEVCEILKIYIKFKIINFFPITGSSYERIISIRHNINTAL